jgi:4-amino-4-deoxy-L-arabinose transferase-like glycosyltransferase
VERRTRGFAQRLAVVAVIGLCVRVGYVLLFRVDLIPLGGDSIIYSLGANLLAHGHGFVAPLDVFSPVFHQSADHPPLYLIWLAIPAFLDPSSGDTSQTVLMLWSCALGTGTVVLCGLAGRRLAGARCGLIAAALAAVYPNIWVWDGTLLSETISLFMVALVILLSYRFLQAPSTGGAVALGLACGLAALSRAELILTLPLVLLPAVAFVRGGDRARRLRWLAVGGVASIVVMGPWVVFNLTRFAKPVYISTGFGGTLAAGNCDASYHGSGIGSKNYACGRATFLKVVDEAAAHHVTLDAAELDAAVRAETMKYVRAHRSRVPLVVAARWGRVTGLFNSRQEIWLDALFYRKERWVVEAGFYSYYAVAALAVFGAITLRRRRVPLFPLVAFPVVVLVSVAITFAQIRYRSPAEVSLVLLAAVAIDEVVRHRRARAQAARPASKAPGQRSGVVPATKRMSG